MDWQFLLHVAMDYPNKNASLRFQEAPREAGSSKNAFEVPRNERLRSTGISHVFG